MTITPAVALTVAGFMLWITVMLGFGFFIVRRQVVALERVQDWTAALERVEQSMYDRTVTDTGIHPELVDTDLPEFAWPE